MYFIFDIIVYLLYVHKDHEDPQWDFISSCVTSCSDTPPPSGAIMQIHVVHKRSYILLYL